MTFGNAAIRHGLSLIVFLKWIDYSSVCPVPSTPILDIPTLISDTMKSNLLLELVSENYILEINFFNGRFLSMCQLIAFKYQTLIFVPCFWLYFATKFALI